MAANKYTICAIHILPSPLMLIPTEHCHCTTNVHDRSAHLRGETGEKRAVILGNTVLCCVSSLTAIAEISAPRVQPEVSRSHILEDALQHHMILLMQIQANDPSHAPQRICAGMEQAPNRAAESSTGTVLKQTCDI